MKLKELMTSWLETLRQKKLQETFVNGVQMVYESVLVVGRYVVRGFKLVLDYLWLVPFVIALLLQMSTMFLVWLMVGFGALLMSVRDWVAEQTR